MTSETLDQAKMDAFGGMMLGILNSGMLSIMISIGHQTGLFDAMAALPPSTSDQIAHKAGLNERYVREWLAAMLVGKIVKHDAELNTYSLPPEHAAMLTAAAGPDNMAAFARIIPILATVEREIIDCFHNGGGVSYESFDEFMTFWADINAETYERRLIDRVMPLLPRVTSQLESGAQVLEIGCGEGHSTNIMARTYPNSQFTGYEFREEAIETARIQAQSLGLSNITFSMQDIAALDEPATYDLVTALDVIHDQAQPRTVLKAVYDTLKPDGTFLMVDIKASSHPHENVDHPMGPWLYTTSTMHCMPVSLAYEGEGLGTMWGEQKALELLNEAGFSQVDVKQVEGDPFNNYYIARKT